MYQKLIDTVSSIVKAHGVGILSDSRFWNILTDSYPFGSDYSLRDTFKKCIAEGYVSEIVSLKGKSQKTIDKIKDVVAKEHKTSPTKDGEYIAILFSVAIAIGSCSKKDYLKLIKGCSPQTKPQPKPTPRPNNTPQKYNISLKEWVLSSVYYLIGLAFAIGGTIFLSAFYNDWWLFFIVLFTGFAQLCFCACVMTNMEEVKNEDYRTTVLSFLLPVFCAFVSNALLSFLFFFESFRKWMGAHLSGFPHSPEGPYFITFLLIIIYVLFVGFAAASCYSYNFSWPINLNKLRKRILIISAIIVVILYSLLFFLPIIERGIRDYNNNVEKHRAENQRKELIDKNRKIHNERIVIEKDLSFKNIKLGISYDTAIEYANDIAEEKSLFENSSNYHFFVNSDDIIDVMTEKNVEYAISDEIKDDKNFYTGQTYTVKTLLDKKDIYLTIYERGGLVFALSIKPGTWSSSSFDDEDFKNLLKLYISKYGEPEKLGSFLLDDTYYYGRDNEKYVWQYKNGTIRITNTEIVYVSDDFIRTAKSIYLNEKREREARERHISDSIRVEQAKKDSICREEAIRDSIRHAHSHQNAINEI